jgi:hypothetical protein
MLWISPASNNAMFHTIFSRSGSLRVVWTCLLFGARISVMRLTSLLNGVRVGIVARVMVDRNQRAGAVTRVKRFDRRILTRGGVSVIPMVLSRWEWCWILGIILWRDLWQCVEEGWSDKLKEQADEGCNVSGRIRVNKVVGSIQISPGRSYQAGSRTFQDLVPYLRDDSNPHDFSHIIHEFFFMADDEYNPNKAKIGKDMKERMGISDNPLDGVEAKVKFSVHGS